MEKEISDKRSKNVKKNIMLSFLTKIVGVGLTFLVLPLTVNYLTQVEYGVWVTLFSVMNWVNLLDMGIGLGVRNKLAEAVAKNNLEEMRQYISTGFVSLLMMGSVLLFLFFVAIQFVSMQSIYNTKIISEEALFQATAFTGVFVIATFVLSLVNQFYYAWQQSAKTGYIAILHNLMMLIIIYLLTLNPHHALVYFVAAFGLSSVASRGIFFLSFFYSHRNLTPQGRYVKFSCFKKITNLGLRFFVIQLAVICVFSSSNILITQRLGPEHILAYDVVLKIFSSIVMVHGIISAPLWNAYTDALVKRDFLWMRNMIKKMLFLMVPILLACVLLGIFADDILYFWLGKTIELPPYLVMAAGAFVAVNCLSSVWATFLNGVGEITLQMWLAIFEAFAVIPLAWWLMPWLDVSGMLFAIVICLSVGVVPLGLQVRNYLKRGEGY